MTELNIVYQDDYLLILDKPAGLLMHPSWLDRSESDTLAGRVKQYLATVDPAAKVHTIHRLDRPTSGLVIIAKQDAAAKSLLEQFAQRQVSKTYWAVCRGFAPSEQSIEQPLKEELDKIADKFADTEKAAQPAQTFIKRLAISELAIPVSRYPKMRLSWLECMPQTGRKHQIRRHLKHIRHPIIGDTRHGCRHINQALKRHGVDLSLALRAVTLTFQHPQSGHQMTIKAPQSEQWQAWFMCFGWSGSYT